MSFILSIEAFCALDIINRVEVLQELSRCLKELRVASHPERSIGRSSRKRKKTSEGDSKAAALWTMQNFERVLSSFESASACHHYFLLSLLVDVMKCAPPPSFVQSILRYATFLLRVTDLYLPNVQRILDICDKCVQYVEIEQDCVAHDLNMPVCEILITVHRCILAKYSMTDVFRTHSHNSCVLVDISFVCTVGSHFLISAMTLVNILAAEVDSRGEIDPLKQLICVLCSIFDAVTLMNLVRCLAECDVDIIKFLLQLFRFSNLQQQFQSRDQSSNACFSMMGDMRTRAIRCFVSFIVKELCFDVSTLIDLVCGAETDALLLLLRALKCMTLSPISVEDAVQYISSIQNDSDEANEEGEFNGVAIFVCSERIIRNRIEDAEFLPLCNSAIHFKRSPVAPSSPNPLLNPHISVRDMCQFFKSLHKQVLSMSEKGVIAFTCTPLLRRLEEVTRALDDNCKVE